MRETLIVFVLLAALAWTQAAATRGELLFPKACPPDGPHQACLMVDFAIDDDRVHVRDVIGQRTAVKFVTIRGRLGTGKPKAHILAFPDDLSDAYDPRETFPGRLPYLGRSSDFMGFRFRRTRRW